MTKPQSNNPKPSDSGRSEGFNKQLPPSTTSTPMPKVKPPTQKSK